jgi:hypothetical protein
MAKRTNKCQWCKVSDTSKEEMDIELVGKNQSAKYYHKVCYVPFLKEKEFKKKERVELDSLIEVIKEIYGVKVIPNSAYPFLQDLRNGTKFFGKYDYSYKQGYSYSIIAETYDYCSDTIQYYNGVKSFNGFMGAFRYGLAIVCDKLSIVEQRKKQRENSKVLIEKHIDQMEDDNEFATSYKPSNKSSITEFLDD